MVTIEEIITELRYRNVPEKKIQEVQKSYELAAEIHKNQFRESNEPYIIHPLNVAKNILKMEVYDPNTISAALLHDTIEDAQFDFTKEDIAKLINEDVAELVDGVTKMRRMDFSTKDAQKLANTRKLINGLTKDVRIIIIKLADRLHNMETLSYKKPQKQKDNAIETMELFVPLSLSIGAYRIKNELEDLSLQYIEPEAYKIITEEKAEIKLKQQPYLDEMAAKIQEMLNQRNIHNDIIHRSQTICTIWKKVKQGFKVENIYDLFYLKVLVDEVEKCYQTLYMVHKDNRPINGKFKDYIFNPRTNFYQSLHTTVSDSTGQIRKVKIRTYDMDKVAAFGIPAFWNLQDKDRKTQEETQDVIREKCQFAKKLIELEYLEDNAAFMKRIKRELLSDHIYVYKSTGEIIELPSGSTVREFIETVYPHQLDKVTGAIVNGKEVPRKTKLNNNDRIQVTMYGNINYEDSESLFQKIIRKNKK